MTGARGIMIVAGIACLGLLAACRGEERDRPLRFEPGVYKGEKTPSLTEERRRELRDRGNLMR